MSGDSERDKLAALSAPVGDAEVTNALVHLSTIRGGAHFGQAFSADMLMELITRLDSSLARVRTFFAKVPKPPNAITWELGVELLNELQAVALATLNQPEKADDNIV